MVGVAHAPEGDPFLPRRLVVFDIDGTLYDQRRLRMRMLSLLAADAARRRDLTVIRILRTFRARRELLAQLGVRDFESRLFAETARDVGVQEALVRHIVADWIDTRPLPHLANCMTAGTIAFFARLRLAGVAIGILSDYPAQAKLLAMGLEADHLVAANDPGVAVLKPDPRGLAQLLERAGCQANDALMIGDRPECDGAAAAALGMDFLLRRSGRPRLGLPQVRDFTDRRLAALLPG